MRFSSLLKQMIRRPVRRASLAVIFLFAGLAMLIALPPAGSSHEPITTNVKFNKEVIRIFQRSCLGCHGEKSLTGIQLATYEQARPWAKAIKEEVLEKRMPPYQAVKGFGRFHTDYTLAQREIDLIVSWVEGGAPKGDDKDLPRPPASSGAWALGQPDLVLQPEGETKITAEGDDEYRCFVLPTKLNEDRWVTAVDFHPGNSTVVHCASLSIDRTSQSRMLDVAPSGSVECATSNRETAADSLGEWMPSQMINRLPAGVGRLLPAGSRVVLKVHYRKNGEAAIDRSAVGFYFSKGPVTRPLRGVTLAAPETSIPPGAERHRIKVSYIVPEAAEAIAIRPLLYPFGKSVEAIAFRPDGTTEALIWIKNYRYHWQPTYYFKRPVALPKGTRIEVTAYLDNSDDNPNNPHDPPQAVRFADAVCELYFTTVAVK
jgi:hypothetical protein